MCISKINLNKKKQKRESNLNPYMCVIVIFLIVPCICTGYTLVGIKLKVATCNSPKNSIQQLEVLVLSKDGY